MIASKTQRNHLNDLSAARTLRNNSGLIWILTDYEGKIWMIWILTEHEVATWVKPLSETDNRKVFCNGSHAWSQLVGWLCVNGTGRWRIDVASSMMKLSHLPLWRAAFHGILSAWLCCGSGGGGGGAVMEVCVPKNWIMVDSCLVQQPKLLKAFAHRWHKTWMVAWLNSLSLLLSFMFCHFRAGTEERNSLSTQRTTVH